MGITITIPSVVDSVYLLSKYLLELTVRLLNRVRLGTVLLLDQTRKPHTQSNIRPQQDQVIRSDD